MAITRVVSPPGTYRGPLSQQGEATLLLQSLTAVIRLRRGKEFDDAKLAPLELSDYQALRAHERERLPQEVIGRAANGQWFQR